MNWKAWIVSVASAVGAVAGGKLVRGWTGVVVGALAGVAAGLLAGWALDRPAAGLAAPDAGERVEP